MRNNKFARELVAEDTVERLVGYMLDDAGLFAAGEAPVDPSSGTSIPSSPPKPVDPVLASLAATSSLTSSIAVFIELIRKNNSDYSEPHLFHTLRNGLMAKSSLVAAAAASRVDDGEVVDADQKDIDDRKGMEEAMEVINTKMGIVHLGSLLTVLSARLGSFQELIKTPRTKVSSSLIFLFNEVVVSRLTCFPFSSARHRHLLDSSSFAHPRALPNRRTLRRTPSLLQHGHPQPTERNWTYLRRRWSTPRWTLRSRRAFLSPQRSRSGIGRQARGGGRSSELEGSPSQLIFDRRFQ